MTVIARRVRSATELVVILVVLGAPALNVLKAATAVRIRPSIDRVSLHQRHLENLRSVLPVGVRQLGYTTDVSPEELPRDAAALSRYYLVQYALVPAVVAPVPEGDFVVGQFSGTPARPPRLPPGLSIVKDIGDGVLLLQRAAR